MPNLIHLCAQLKKKELLLLLLCYITHMQTYASQKQCLALLASVAINWGVVPKSGESLQQADELHLYHKVIWWRGDEDEEEEERIRQ